jgi:periplasmic divalent cation tolerance protein
LQRHDDTVKLDPASDQLRRRWESDVEHVTDVVLILTTVPAASRADAIARSLVDERLAACVNVLSTMTSFYRWQGKIEQEDERQIVIKTTRDRVAAVQTRLKDLHAYEVPEFLVLPVSDGSTGYLDWVRKETR